MSTDALLNVAHPQLSTRKHGEIGLPFGLIYTSEELKRDVLAGLTVAAIALPEAMAYALLAG
ncbi:MAG: hypothetical protein JOZ29_00200, partial [Deltaproteobacteria bacterium]|nr:hypothetical protein [Deltaproteobacteria bacterium]